MELSKYPVDLDFHELHGEMKFYFAHLCLLMFTAIMKDGKSFAIVSFDAIKFEIICPGLLEQD